MKTKRVMLFTVALAITTLVFANDDTVSVQKAFESSLIKLEIQGKGGYQGPCITMLLTSEHNEPMVIYVEAGRRLDSKDSTQQDILVVQDLFVSLPAKQKKKVDVTGFCCQAHNGAPKEKSVFFVGRLADNNLYQIARYIYTEKIKNTSTIQNAVWCISDNNELSSVYDDGTEEVAKLRKYLADLKGIVMPWYSIVYKKEKDVLFSGVAEKVIGRIEYYISDFSQVIANIRDEKGIIVRSFFIGGKVARGSYVFNMDWDVKKIPKAFYGKYTVAIYQNGRELNKKVIDLK
ncbi:MAG: hypothetical protein ACXVC6_03000 [Bacteroidia bacterium]